MHHIKPFKHQIGFLASDDVISQIELEFRQFLNAYAMNEFLSLPAKDHYYDVFFKCYFGFARLNVLKRMSFCPTHQQCNIPKFPNLNCSVAAVPFAFSAVSSDLIVHYPTKLGYMNLSKDGC